MQITVDLSDKQVKFLQWMIASQKKFESSGTIEQAVKECIDMAMFDEGESMAMQEGM